VSTSWGPSPAGEAGVIRYLEKAGMWIVFIIFKCVLNHSRPWIVFYDYSLEAWSSRFLRNVSKNLQTSTGSYLSVLQLSQ
jgi:hypothetical protein